MTFNNRFKYEKLLTNSNNDAEDVFLFAIPYDIKDLKKKQ